MYIENGFSSPQMQFAQLALAHVGVLIRRVYFQEKLISTVYTCEHLVRSGTLSRKLWQREISVYSIALYSKRWLFKTVF